MRLLISAFLFAALAFFSSTVNLAAAPRPNVIVIMTDDQGYGDLSVHGNPVCETPNLDELARHSIRLTDFHVAPMCTPTRGQLVTGQDALRNRAMNVSSGRTLLKRGLPTLPSLLAADGYRTAIFGKWHLGDNYPYRPEDRGFQETLWFPSSHIGAAPDYWENDYFDDVYYHNGVREQVDGYSTDVFFGQAIEWIDSVQGSGEPFFAYIPTNAPHGPLFVPDKYRGPVRESLAAALDELPELNPNQRRDLISFLAMIENIDENVGRLLKFLDDRKLADNTMVIFLTDNGSTMGPAYYNAGMRGGKTTLWEGGHRVPCFIRWPQGDLGAGREVDELTQVQDLLPTILELCGVSLKQPLRFDGTSLAELLRGAEPELPDRMLVINYSRMPFDDEGEPASVPKKSGAAVLWNKWRLLHGKELYNLAADLGQIDDVSDEHPDVVAKMRAHLDQWWEEIERGLGVERVIIGHEADNPTTLTACEWLDVFVDQQNQVRQGVRRNGIWHLEVDHAGPYQFEVRRWPAESGLALRSAPPATVVTDGQYAAGKSLPIRAARLEIQGRTYSKPAAAGDEAVRFDVELQSGPCQMQATFLDVDGEEICGAYYVVAEAKSLPQ